MYIMKRYIHIAFLVVITVLSILYYEYYKIEQLNDTYAVCILTRKPSVVWLDFLHTWTHEYDIYVMIDDNQLDITELVEKYKNIRFLQIEDSESIEKGYVNVNYIFNKPATSWDKALYYFCEKNTSYKNVWFIEDDVYIPSMKHLIQLDEKYQNVDLICNQHGNNYDGQSNGWSHWGEAEKYFELPWSNGLQCICRMSDSLLSKIKGFVETEHTLTFLEVLFPTITDQNHFIYAVPTEFEQVECCRTYGDWKDINPNAFYHPVKDFEHQKQIRETL